MFKIIVILSLLILASCSTFHNKPLSTAIHNAPTITYNFNITPDINKLSLVFPAEIDLQHNNRFVSQQNRAVYSFRIMQHEILIAKNHILHHDNQARILKAYTSYLISYELIGNSIILQPIKVQIYQDKSAIGIVNIPEFSIKELMSILAANKHKIEDTYSMQQENIFNVASIK
jgi:hypothetical protein